MEKKTEAKQFIERLEAINPPPQDTYTKEEDGEHYKISIHPRASLRRQAENWLANFGAVERKGEVFRLPKETWGLVVSALKNFGLTRS